MDKQIVIAGFPIDDEMSLKKYGSVNDIRYLVSNHGRGKSYGRDGSGTWCYYVFIDERQLPAEQFAEFWLTATMVKRSAGEEPTYDYNAPRWAGAEWHGGVTFYEKLGGIDGTARAVKIGCDFAHYWDRERGYDFADVEREAKKTVAELQAMYTFNRRCPWNGKWQPAEKMVEVDGRLYSVEGAASRARSA